MKKPILLILFLAVGISAAIIGFKMYLSQEQLGRAEQPNPNSVRESGGCYIGGCNSQICSDQKNVISNCLWTETFACYKTAKCERQKDRQCGWTRTKELDKCLKD